MMMEEPVYLISQTRAMISSAIVICLLQNRLITSYLMVFIRHGTCRLQRLQHSSIWHSLVLCENDRTGHCGIFAA